MSSMLHRRCINWLKKMAGNSWVTLDQLISEMVKWEYMNRHYITPSEMFIEGQYNWERPEYDDHA